MMLNFIKKQSPARIITIGFALLILAGSCLLMLPCSIKNGFSVKFIDALYTATSAVCVTGLSTLDTGNTFTPLGQFFIALLMQIGGLGVTTVGALIIIAIGKKINLKGRNLIREAMNTGSGKGLIKLVYEILTLTVFFELIGAFLSYFVFVRDYPPLKALGISLFHSVAAFNNAGFDILGNFQSLAPYRDNFILNTITSVLIISGGIGFLVIRDIWSNHFRWKKLSMHSKVVISMTAFLILAGTLLLKLTENITWLGAFFISVSSRTAGFATYPLEGFSHAGLLTIILLMIIGASPGSTGGGIKTTTFFSLLQGIKSAATNSAEKAFNYSLPKEAFRKSAVIILLAIGIIFCGTYIMCITEPNLALSDILFEIASAFSTTGFSTGITSHISITSKLLSILIMFTGRLGPLTIATLWHFSKGERVRYPEGNITIG